MDKKHGNGIYIWADGRKYDGLWANGKQHGEGKYVLPDGTIRVGIWEEGKRIDWIDQKKASNQDLIKQERKESPQTGQNTYNEQTGKELTGNELTEKS
jgi:hypothetical protein